MDATAESHGQGQGVARVALVTAACLLGDAMLYVALPLRWQEAGLASLWEAGAVLSVNRLVRLPLHPLIGWLYQRIDRRAGIGIAVALAAATTLAYGFVQGLAAWLAVRCVWGLAWALLRQGGYLLVLDASEETGRGHSVGRYNGLSRLGSLAGVLGGGLLVDLHGLAAAALVLGAIPLAAIPALYTWPAARSRMAALRTGEAPASSGLPGSAPGLTWVLLTGSVGSLLFQGVLPATLSALLEVRCASTCRGAAIGASTAAGGLLALRWAWEPWLAPLCGRLADGPGGARPLLVRALAAAALLLLVLSTGAPLLVWAIVLLGVLVAATALTTSVDALVLHRATPGSRERLISAHALAQDLGAAAGPYLGLAVFASVGPAALLQGAAALLLPLSAWGWSSWRLRGRHPGE